MKLLENLSQRTHKLVFNTISALIARLINLIVTIFSLPLLISYLGHSTYGVFVMIISFTSMISFSDLGLSLGLLSNVPKYKTSTDPYKLAKVITATFTIICVTSLTLLFLFLMFYSKINWSDLFNIQDLNTRDVTLKMVFAFILVYLFGAPFNISNNYLIGIQKAYFVEGGKAIGNLLMLGLLYLAIKANMTPSSLIFIYIGSSTLITLITFIVLFYIIQPELRPKWKLFDWKTTKSLFSDSSRYFILQIFTLMLVSLDPIIIGRIIKTESVTTYSVIYRIVTIVSIPSVLIASQMLPSLNDAFITDDKMWMKKTINSILITSLIYIFAMYFAFTLLGNRILILWLGSSFQFNSLQWLAITFFLSMMILNTIFSMIFLMPNFLKFTLIIFPIAVISSFFTKIYFLHNYGLTEMIGISSLFYIIIYCLPCYIYLRFSKFI